MVRYGPGGEVVSLSEHPGVVCQGVEPGVGGLTAFQLCAGHPLIAGLGDDSENVRVLFIARQGITEEFSVKKCQS